MICTLDNIYSQTGIPFIFIIDERDCIFREQQNDIEAQRIYLDFLRRRQYIDKIKDYSGEVLLVGISYDTKEKTGSCVIEKFSK